MAASTLIERLSAAGIDSPRIAIQEAKKAGLPLEMACALLEKESGGGANAPATSSSGMNRISSRP